MSNRTNGTFSFQKSSRSKAISLHILKIVIAVLLILSSIQISSYQEVEAASEVTFTGSELVGNPTDSSIVINIIPQANIEYHYQYGTVSGSYPFQTTNFNALAGQPDERSITGLSANTRYYYRMRYHAPGDGMEDWVTRSEHSFMTQRAIGSTFTFAVTSDSHNAGATTPFTTSMQSILNNHPDFLIDIGDTQFAEFTRNSSIQSNLNNAYKEYRANTHFGAFGHSVPIFLSTGNHEEEEGWNLDDSYSRGVADIQARKAFFPTPVDGDFYSGNTDPLAAIDESVYGDEMREDYYAWEWGDALFVVIDPFQYTMNLPYAPAAGEESDDSQTGNQWSWTLGAQQFQWLKDTLENSNAKYKFMFSHNMLGGINRTISGVGAGYVRGGAEAARYYEWGGKDASENYVFNDFRDPELFGTKPIHQLMVENGVSAYFHGHDHQYVYELRDDIVYQEVPSPSMSGSGFTGIYTVGTYADYQTVAMCSNAGYLRVTVSPEEATVEYVNTGTVTCNPTSFARSYTIAPNSEEESVLGDVNGDGNFNSSDALIILSGDVGMNVSAFCPMNCGDLNGDGLVTSTDALILLSHDVGITVPYPIGVGACPVTITQPAGCQP